VIVETKEDFRYIVNKLACLPMVSFDCETTSLSPFTGGEIFAVTFATQGEEYYFDFNPLSSFSWDTPSILSLQPIFNSGIRFAHNAKFDMNFLAKYGIKFPCVVHDTEVGARLIYNDHERYTLDACASRDLGSRKSDKVMEYMNEHKLYTKTTVEGKEFKNYHFNKVPFEIMSEYAMKDARLTYDLGVFQINRIKSISEELNVPKLSQVYLTELYITNVCFEMEQRGILINKDYCRKAIEYETSRYQSAEANFKSATGVEFVDSGKHLAPIFKNLGFQIQETTKGNPQITDEFLEGINHPVAEIVREYRDASKRCNSYFKNFLALADHNGVLHTNYRQSGTKTGRFSLTQPALQTLGKKADKESQCPVRKAIIPRPGYYFLMLDYKAMEFRMMMDYAGQLNVIKKIKEGFDPHQATSELANCSRDNAKILAFGISYGMGKAKLAKALGCSEQEAIKFKANFFRGLPKLEQLIDKCSKTVTYRKWVFDWLGRRFHFPDSKFSYRATNAVIQGGCADVVKKAMVEIAPAIKPYDIHMILQVHDELLFEVPISNRNALDIIQPIMELAYPCKHLPLTCSVSHSLLSWGDVVEGDISEAARNQVQRNGTK